MRSGVVPLVGFCVMVSVAPVEAAAVTLERLIGEMVDLDDLTRSPREPYVTRQFSSYDRGSTTADAGDSWFANRDRGHFLRVEQRDGRKEHVLMDAEGPGCVVRIWSANPEGTIRIYLDGSADPAIEAPMADLLHGRVSGFGAPFAGMRGRGCNLYYPIPYARSCKITGDERDIYYQVGYRTYAAGTSVETWSEDAHAAARATLDRVRGWLTAPDPEDRPGPRIALPLEKEFLGSRRITRADGLRSLVTWSRSPTEPEGRAVRRLEIRVEADDVPTALRGIRLIGTFDGEKTIDVPIGDFFGSAPGINPYVSLPLEVREDGRLICRWVMPCRDSLDLAVVSSLDAPARIVARALVGPYGWGSRSMHLFATWRVDHEIPTQPPIDWRYLEAAGRGRYVGNVLSLANPVKIWWGEGDEKIWTDDEEFPGHFGTGTEDYYGYAWGDTSIYHHAYHNQTRCDGPRNHGHTSVNRFHILDSIPFERRLRFDIEVWHWNREIRMSYAVANWWYGAPGATHATPAIDESDLRVPTVPEIRRLIVKDAIEGERMRVVRSTGSVEVQGLEGHGEALWSRDAHLWWRDGKPGDGLVLELEVPAAGRYQVTGAFTRAVDYGIHRLSLGGKPLGEAIDFFHRGVVPTGPVELGSVELPAGKVQLTVECVGTNPDASPKNHMFGLDYLRLVPVSSS